MARVLGHRDRRARPARTRLRPGRCHRLRVGSSPSALEPDAPDRDLRAATVGDRAVRDGPRSTGEPASAARTGVSSTPRSPCGAPTNSNGTDRRPHHPMYRWWRCPNRRCSTVSPSDRAGRAGTTRRRARHRAGPVDIIWWPCTTTDNEVDAVLNALGILAVVALIAANGYFVAGEFAFVAARRSKFAESRRARPQVTPRRRRPQATELHAVGSAARHHRHHARARLHRRAGDRRADRTGAQGARPSGLGVVRHGVRRSRSSWPPIAQMVFGELAPKNLAIAKPEPVARALASSTVAVHAVRRRRSSDCSTVRPTDCSALVGVEPVEELHNYVSAEELDLIVDSSAESGHLTMPAGGAARAGDQLQRTRGVRRDGAVEPRRHDRHRRDRRGPARPDGVEPLAVPRGRRRRQARGYRARQGPARRAADGVRPGAGARPVARGARGARGGRPVGGVLANCARGRPRWRSSSTSTAHRPAW